MYNIGPYFSTIVYARDLNYNNISRNKIIKVKVTLDKVKGLVLNLNAIWSLCAKLNFNFTRVRSISLFNEMYAGTVIRDLQGAEKRAGSPFTNEMSTSRRIMTKKKDLLYRNTKC